MSVTLSNDYESARLALNEQHEKSCFLALQLDKAVGETLQVVSSGMGLDSLTLNETDFTFVLYKFPSEKHPYLMFYKGRDVPPHIHSAVLVRFAIVIKLLEPFSESFLEIFQPDDLTEESILEAVERGHFPLNL